MLGIENFTAELMKSVTLFLPETVLVIAFLVALISDLLFRKSRNIAGVISIIGYLVAGYFLAAQSGVQYKAFANLLVIDSFGQFFKLLRIDLEFGNNVFGFSFTAYQNVACLVFLRASRRLGAVVFLAQGFIADRVAAHIIVEEGLNDQALALDFDLIEDIRCFVRAFFGRFLHQDFTRDQFVAHAVAQFGRLGLTLCGGAFEHCIKAALRNRGAVDLGNRIGSAGAATQNQRQHCQ